MKFSKLLLVMTLGPVMLCSCNKKSGSKEVKEVEPAIDMSALDTTISPRQDFYLFVNKGWMKANPLKAAYSRYGTFDVLRDRSLDRIHNIVNELLTKDLSKGTDEYRVGVIYRQYMDSTTRNELGAAPIKPRLEEIEAIQNKKELAQKAGEWDSMGEGTLFGSYVGADAKNSSINILYVLQPGLALGNRDSYLKTDKLTQENLSAYYEYTKKLLELAGYKGEDINRIADNNLKISKEIAEMSYSREELRDVQKNYNMKEVKIFVSENKNFDWQTYFEQRNLKDLRQFNVSQLEYFKKFDRWMASVDLRALKDFLIVNEIDAGAGLLSDDFSKASFDFYGKVLSGRKEQHPRWRRAVSLVQNIMGEALGKLYVERHFQPKDKERMLTLVENLQKALGERIASLEWMSEETKAKAQEKLSNFTVKIGYPDKWKDYSALNIDEEKSLYENVQAARLFEYKREMDDLGKEVDRTRWLMNPQDVNAYYMPTTNEICFPAGILQPPFYNSNADDAVNYGAIGVVIGHEMTHGFDDQGANFNKEGNMVNWWTEEDAKKFAEAGDKLAAQFDQIKITDDLQANGRLTLGENIADQGGLLVSYLALQKALKGKEETTIDGFTPAQRFFIAYARVWGQNITPQERILLTKEDVHSLGEFRVNQTLKNIPAFYDAFDIQEGDPMYLAPEERVLVW